MKIVKDEMPLGGGEGSVIHYSLKVGDVFIHIATSKSIKFSKSEKYWVDELYFMYPFSDFEELKELLNDCDDRRLAKFIFKELQNELG